MKKHSLVLFPSRRENPDGSNLLEDEVGEEAMSLPTNQDIVVKCLFSKVEAFQSNCYWQNIFAEVKICPGFPGISLPAELNLRASSK